MRRSTILGGALIVILATGVGACFGLDYLLNTQVPMVDVSRQPPYSGLVGRRFLTRRPTLAIGVTADRQYKKQIDVIVLVEPPGFGGREVMSEESLPPGESVEVIRVRQGTWPFMSRMKYEVRLRAGAIKAAGPVEVDVTGSVHDANAGLPPSVFQPTE